MQIAVVGHGAIGAAVLGMLQNQGRVQVGWVVVSQLRESVLQAVRKTAPGAQVVTALPLEARPDCIVECAGHAAVEQHVLPALERGVQAIVTSIGAISAPGMLEKLEAAAARGQTQVQLVSGAIGGMDALAAARLGGLDAVVYTGRKPPLAWLGTPAEQCCDLVALQEAVCIFEGSAREAAQLYPKNANVAATISLAGLGLDRTQVRLFADPSVSENLHQWVAQGVFGQMEVQMRGRAMVGNAKTSALTAFSVVRAVLNRVALVRIG